ncbi:hypothetical protein ACIP9H_29465 [Streptomyces sp. NPDC088732]|uniref:hypothetical protein n=1 Tax=Streptomyces sp. NPDC088732 TaxID=3365879 RepID=UPI0038029123
MNLTVGSVTNMAPANADWHIAFDLGGDSDIVVCPVIGWATVVTARMEDGAVITEIQPAFVWGGQVWTEAELRVHAPGLGSVSLRHPHLAATAGPKV